MPEHPGSRPVLPQLMALSFLSGALLFLAGHGQEGALGVLATLAGVVLLACGVVFVGLYGLAWLLHEHELWRQAVQRQTVPPAQDR